jgi:hypothetical protein
MQQNYCKGREFIPWVHHCRNLGSNGPKTAHELHEAAASTAAALRDPKRTGSS